MKIRARHLANKAVRLAKKHSNELLTVVELGGLGLTAYLSAKGGKKSAQTDKRSEKIKGYIPAVAAGTVTAGAIILNGHMNRKQKAALMAAYLAADQSLKKFKDHMSEEQIKEVEKKIRDEAYQEFKEEQEAKQKAFDDQIIDCMDDSEMPQLFYDNWSGEWFDCSMNKFLRAKAELLEALINDGEVTLAFWYSSLGLPVKDEDRYSGWDLSDDGFLTWGPKFIELIKVCEDPELGIPEHYQIDYSAPAYLLNIG